MSKDKITTVEKLPDILTPQQIADYVGISRQTVYDLCQYGKIKSFNVGASRKIKKSDMLLWLSSLQN